MALPEFAEPMAPHAWKLVVVPWDKRLYLVRDEALRDFCNDVNMGTEPRDSLPGSYFARFGNGRREVDAPTGQPTVPAPWNKFLLSHPVTAPISAIVHTGRERQGPGGSGGEIIAITVDAGSSQNLQPGMLLYMPSTPEFTKKYAASSQYALIKSVTSDHCVAEFTTFVTDLPVNVGMSASTHGE